MADVSLIDYPRKNVPGSYRWHVNIGLANDLVPGNKLLYEPMSTQFDVTIWRH